jgi:hypothetical protein
VNAQIIVDFELSFTLIGASRTLIKSTIKKLKKFVHFSLLGSLGGAILTGEISVAWAEFSTLD